MTNDSKTQTIAEFLLARIAEDESDHYPYNSIDFGHYLEEVRFGCVDCGIQEDRACRVQRECAAKREIVGGWTVLDGNSPRWRNMDRDTIGAYHEWKDTLEVLAAVYKDHPDYQQEWAA